ncbi:hypothetical protein ACFV6E_37515 [Streptomyces sp. NPDC059785]|uniref:hypothetical protein n=1 Tax=Streptomyces sp. NPDC059785 TaxID=3346945 RepID=UPI0036482DA0
MDKGAAVDGAPPGVSGRRFVGADITVDTAGRTAKVFGAGIGRDHPQHVGDDRGSVPPGP